MPMRYQVGLLGVVAVLLAARPARVAGEEQARPHAGSAAAAAAAMAGLNACFTENWGDSLVFVEAGPLIPAGLTRVGGYEAKVISEQDLKRRFQGKQAAPSLARLRVVEEQAKGRTVYTVEISYAGVPVKGATSIPIGGGRWYKYTVDAGKVVLMEQGSVKY